MNPHDLLPIKRPLEDRTSIRPTQFYEDVVQHLIPDIVRISYNGIPIDLEQVRKLEQILDDTLSTVQSRLAQNSVVRQFLEQTHTNTQAKKKQALEAKYKAPEDFLVPFNIHNKTHRSYVVNTHLKSIAREDMIVSEWSVKDLKKLNQILADNFLNNLIAGNIQSWMQPTITLAMETLAKDKATIYNKNKIQTRINKLRDESLPQFNPASSLQKQQFFTFCGIESESETDAGSAKWDRKELERLQKLLTILLDEKVSGKNENNIHS